jgi:hypothetical protein
LKKAFYFFKNWQRSDTLFSTGRAAEKERHARTPSCCSWQHQLFNSICYLFLRLQQKEAMLGRRWLQLFNNRCFPFPGLQKRNAMLGRHLAGVGGISCLLLVCFLLVGMQKKKRLNAGVGGII